jgi:predicted Rossmann fold flavoprotein
MLKCADFVAIGGGAAGIFAALAAKNANPAANVIVLERTGSLLAKVKISGGGRCNVTHACFDPLQLVKNYPRGNKALIGPFTRFQPRDTVDWFASRGVELNTEADGRMFPITNTSQTIIDCLLNEAKKLNVDIRLKQKINKIDHDGEYFQIHLETGDVLRCKKVLLATGSHPLGHEIAKSFGHTIQNLVPSLFTFNVPSSPLVDLSGISVPKSLCPSWRAPFHSKALY